MGNPQSGTDDKLDKAIVVRFTDGSLHCSAGAPFRVVPGSSQQSRPVPGIKISPLFLLN
jgi:hypothetical protein